MNPEPHHDVTEEYFEDKSTGITYFRHARFAMRICNQLAAILHELMMLRGEKRQ